MAFLLFLLLLLPSSLAVVNLPGVEYNAAAGQLAHASSYYDYRPNPVRDTVFVPQNAVDGFTDASSWWSSGEEAAVDATRPIFWQLNLSTTPTKLKRIVIRWHGFLTPAGYKLHVSYMGENFQTIAIVANQSIVYDRVDVITSGLDQVDTRFRFLRVVLDIPNVCQGIDACTADGATEALSQSNERIVYGIREFELWATGTKNDAAGHMDTNGWWRWLVVMAVSMVAFR